MSSSMKYVTCFGVSNKKMAFTEEDKILIKVLRQEHGYGARRFLNEFFNSACRAFLATARFSRHCAGFIELLLG